MEELPLVVAFEGMTDPDAIRHLEGRHAHQTGGLMIRKEPDQDERRFRGGKYPWDLYHARLHRTIGAEQDHEHEEAEQDE